MLPPFEAVILDLDGLVLDTETTYWRAWQAAARASGFDLPAELFRRLSGQSIDQVASLLGDAFGPGFDFDHFHRLSSQLWHEWVAVHGIDTQPGYPRLMTLLRQKDIPFLLATNSERRYALRCLELADILEDFPDLVTRDEVTRGKPEPHIYLQAARRLSLPPGSCLAVEDSYPGLLSAYRAGVHPILVASPEALTPEMEQVASLHFPTLAELARAIEQPQADPA